MKRIKHNDLTHYFLRPHQELPQAYLASCEEFFRTILKKKKIQPEVASVKQQAPSNKPQASSNKRLTAQGSYDINRIIKEK